MVSTPLEKEGYTKCENPDDDKFRLYNITKKGLKIYKKIEKYN